MEIKLKQIILFLLLCFTNILAQPTLEWVKEYNGDFAIQRARGIVSDDSGNVYIGVTSFDTLYDYGMALIKYDKEGKTRWIRKYEGTQGTGKSADHLQAITIDKSNNIYITGASEYYQNDPYQDYITFVTIKYNSKGNKQWLAKYRLDSLGVGWYWPYTIAVDKDENVYVGGNFDRAILLKYNANGELLWDKNIDSMETVTKIILDNSASIYISNNNLSIFKYNTQGKLVWKGQCDSLTGMKIYSVNFKVDELGNSYATGFYYLTTYNTFTVTVKYDKNGNLKWLRKYGDEKEYYMFESKGSVIDSNGNFYVCCWFWNQDTFETKYLLLKYDSLGNEQLIGQYNAPDGTWIELLNTGIDYSGYIYLIGRETSFNSNLGDIIFVKFDVRGNVLYTEKYVKLGRNEEFPYITYNIQNDIYILFDSYSTKDQIVITLKYTQKPVGIEHKEEPFPLKPVLYQNYPNPFNPTTAIKYAIPPPTLFMPLAKGRDGVGSYVTLKVYDILGREVKTLVNKQLSPGNYQIEFNAKNLSSGIYYYQLRSGKFTKTKKMILLR